MDYELDGEQNIAEVLTAFSVQPRKRGRPLSLDRQTLINRRDSLRSWLEGYWGHVGWKLERAKNILDVRKALCCGEIRFNQTIQIFVRSTKGRRATIEKLRLTKSHVFSLSQKVHTAYSVSQQSAESLSRVQAAVQHADTKRQKKELLAISEQRKLEHANAQKNYEEVQKQDRLLRAKYDEENASFAQNELLHFIQSDRYSFTPIKLANAMAGLPEMGWRQSAKLCAPHKQRTDPGPIYWLFLQVDRAISKSKMANLPLLEGLQFALESYKNKEDYRLLEAKRNWYHLRRSIENVHERKNERGSLPFRIIAKYQAYAASKDAIEVFLEKEQQLK